MFNFNRFIFENLIDDFTNADILENIITDSDSLLKSVEAEEINLYKTFNLPDNIDIFDIDKLYDNDIFNLKLSEKKLKKNILENTEESETFIKKTIIIKFFLIFNINQEKIENPKYIIFQNIKKYKKEPVKCFKINKDIKKFYDKLTNKTIELKKGNKTYIYNTSNSGLNWELIQSKEVQSDDEFKDIMNSDDIKAILKKGNTIISIID